MKLLILLVSAALLFTSCSNKSNAFDFFKFDKNYEKAISYTKTASLMQSMETKAVITTIYLNKVLADEYNKNDSFFVALYSNEDKIFYDKFSQRIAEYTLTLNDQKPIRIKELKKDSKLRLLMPIKNGWNRYYLVEFKKVKENDLELKFSDDTNQSLYIEYVQDDS